MTPLDTLLAAKAESDRRNYARKHALLRDMMARNPGQFVIDSDDGRGILGLTHVPTNFKVHVPASVPPVPLDKAASALDELCWGVFPSEVERLAEKAAEFAAALPRDGRFLWFDPDAGDAHHGPTPPPGLGERPWLPIKTAAEGAFRPLFSAMQMVPNGLNRMFGGPTPLASMAAGGALGAGLGYGAGLVGEKLLGKGVLNPGRLRKTLALAGAGVGALPGAYLGTVNARLNAEDGQPALPGFVQPNRLFGKQGLDEMAAAADARVPGVKVGNFGGGLYVDSIPVDAFNRVIWDDPSTPVGVRAATSGLLTGASQVRGGANLVSPFDVGKIAVGMGSGLVSGLLVGKALGALAGLTPDAQNTLKQTGMWTGALVNIVPKAFGF